MDLDLWDDGSPNIHVMKFCLTKMRMRVFLMGAHDLNEWKQETRLT